MRKTVSLLLAAFLLILTGCAGGAAQPSAATAAPTAEAVAVTVENTPAPTAIPEPTQLEKVQSAGKLVVAMCPDYAPFEFVDSAKTGQEAFCGADVSLAKYIAEALGVTLEIRSTTFDEALSGVSDGTADLAISCIYPSEERAAAYELSTPYGGAAVPAADAESTAEPAENAENTAEPSAEPAPATSGEMAVLCMKGETELIEAVNGVIATVNRDGLYATWLDEAQMLAEKLKLL